MAMTTSTTITTIMSFIAAWHSRVQPNHWSWSLGVIEGGASLQAASSLIHPQRPAEEKTGTNKYSWWSLTYPARSSTADDPDGSMRRRDPLSMHGRFSELFRTVSDANLPQMYGKLCACSEAPRCDDCLSKGTRALFSHPRRACASV